MLQKLIKFLARLGVVDDMTFRARVEDGVGIFLEPNPRPTRSNLNTVPTPAPARRKVARRASGRWVAKPLHVSW